ncbi:hypothetical protein NDU88_004723 [Pleurodeles waltl]|uniref:Uncharacterized protein n=1 Tax=Pleurodeles waltl TaxID=8319 RepID=A0AAV7WSR1_PLEWA|nr:hypothetical protein NDU88_004723 [Pleurodeles waltl]
MMRQLIEIAQEAFEKFREEVDQLNKRIDEANWGDISVKNNEILNTIIDQYKEDIIQRKKRKFRRDLTDYQLCRVYTFGKQHDNIRDSNRATELPSCSETILSSVIDSSEEIEKRPSNKPTVNSSEEVRRHRLAYIGSTIRTLKTQIQEHFRNIQKNETKYPLVEHYLEHHPNDRTFSFCGLKQLKHHRRGGNLELQLRQNESRLIILYNTVRKGLNKDPEWHYWLQ